MEFRPRRVVATPGSSRTRLWALSRSWWAPEKNMDDTWGEGWKANGTPAYCRGWSANVSYIRVCSNWFELRMRFWGPTHLKRHILICRFRSVFFGTAKSNMSARPRKNQGRSPPALRAVLMPALSTMQPVYVAFLVCHALSCNTLQIFPASPR
jgi:hypothetical protein